MIPSREECIKLLKKHGYYKEHIPIIHAELVERVALKISDMLISKGIDIDKRVVSAAALMHDIGKEDKDHKDHAVRGYNICMSEGLDPRICIAIKHHEAGVAIPELKTWEEKIVSYADKICNTEVDGLDGRFDDWRKRFPEHYEKHKEHLEKSHARATELEKEILNKLGLNPEEMYEILRKER
jgi:putative nucleotidyltransferase with HDIG domain